MQDKGRRPKFDTSTVRPVDPFGYGVGVDGFRNALSQTSSRADAPSPKKASSLADALSKEMRPLSATLGETEPTDRPMVSDMDPPTIPVGSPGPYQPEQPLSPPTPLVTNPAPLDPQKMNGKARLTSLIEQAFRPKPGASIADMNYLATKMTEFKRRMSMLSDNLTADDADVIFDAWYKSVAPESVETPFATFSPEAQGALNEAFGGQMPLKRVAGPQDIDPNSAAMVGGMMLASLFRGRGIDSVMPMVSELLGRAQQRIDLNYENESAEIENRRKKALEQFKRISQIEDYNNEQRGYAARDERTAARDFQKSEQLASRTEDSNIAAQKKAAQTALYASIPHIDPERAIVLGRLFEQQWGEKLPKDFYEMTRTDAQRKTNAQIILTEEETAQVREKTKGIGFDNAVKEVTFESVVRKIAAEGLIKELDAQKLKIEIEKLPEKLDAQTSLLWAQAYSARERAKAALITAQKAGTKGEMTTMDRLKELKSVVTDTDKEVQNYQQQLIMAAQLRSEREEYYNNGVTLGASKEELQSRKAKFDEADAAYKAIATKQRGAENRINEATQEIYRLVKPNQGGN